MRHIIFLFLITLQILFAVSDDGFKYKFDTSQLIMCHEDPDLCNINQYYYDFNDYIKELTAQLNKDNTATFDSYISNAYPYASLYLDIETLRGVSIDSYDKQSLGDALVKVIKYDYLDTLAKNLYNNNILIMEQSPYIKSTPEVNNIWQKWEYEHNLRDQQFNSFYTDPFVSYHWAQFGTYFKYSLIEIKDSTTAAIKIASNFPAIAKSEKMLRILETIDDLVNMQNTIEFWTLLPKGYSYFKDNGNGDLTFGDFLTLAQGFMTKIEDYGAVHGKPSKAANAIAAINALAITVEQYEAVARMKQQFASSEYVMMPLNISGQYLENKIKLKVLDLVTALVELIDLGIMNDAVNVLGSFYAAIDHTETSYYMNMERAAIYDEYLINIHQYYITVTSFFYSHFMYDFYNQIAYHLYNAYKADFDAIQAALEEKQRELLLDGQGKIVEPVNMLHVPSTATWAGNALTASAGDEVWLDIDRSYYKDDLFEASFTLGKPYKVWYNLPNGTTQTIDAVYDEVTGYFVFSIPTSQTIYIRRLGYPIDFAGSIEYADLGLNTLGYIIIAENSGSNSDVNATQPLTKTGQIKSYDESGTEVTDGSIKDDGFYQMGVNPNFTRDDAKEIVTDHLTGLEWQDDAAATSVIKKWITQDNWDAKYYDDTSGDTATTYCETLSLDGDGWRLPTLSELQGLVNPMNAYPAMYSVFQNKLSESYWSSSRSSTQNTNAWRVHFQWGYQYSNFKNTSYHIRCVRGEEKPESSFTRDVTGIVTDNTTGLQWQDDYSDNNGTIKVSLWNGAIQYCEGLSMGGYTDWRMPNLHELLSIQDIQNYPAIYTIFQNTKNARYFSATKSQYSSTEIWTVESHSAYLYVENKDYNDAVRCVRGGQSEASPISKVTFISESPNDYAMRREVFTKSWTFGSVLSDYSVEVVSSDFAFYGTPSVSGDTVTISLTPNSSNVINTIVLKLKDANGNEVKISGSDTFWAKIRTNTPPRLADGQGTQMIGGVSETLSMLIETFDGDSDTVSLNVKNTDGGTVSFSGNTLNTSFADNNTLHTVTITLSDGKESVDKNISVLRFDGTTIRSFYSDVDPASPNYPYDGIYFGTLEGVIAGQVDPNDPSQRIFRPEDNASMAEALAMVVGTAAKARLISLQSSNTYYDVFPRWASPYYSFAREVNAVNKVTDLSVLYPTREQIAQMVVETLGLDEKLAMFDSLNISFGDDAEFSSDTMRRYAQIAHFFGVFMTSSFALPQERINRAELAVVIMNIFKMPIATVSTSKTTMEMGESFTFGATDVVAKNINASSQLYDSSAEVTFEYAVNRQIYSIPSIDSSSLYIGANTLNVLVKNDGVRNLVSTTVTVYFSDDDLDGVQNQNDTWINDDRYAADINGNGIPDIIDNVYGLESYTAEQTIIIDGRSVKISDIIEKGYYDAPAGLNPAILNYLFN